MQKLPSCKAKKDHYNIWPIVWEITVGVEILLWMLGLAKQLCATLDTMSLSRVVPQTQKSTAMKYIFVTKSRESPALLFQMCPSLKSLHAKFGGPRSSGWSVALENVPEKLQLWLDFSL
jgi:hypothetical protein